MDVIDPADLGADELRAQAQQLVEATIRNPGLVQVSAPDVVDVPDGLCRSDGTSVYDRPGRARWALDRTIDSEAWLLQTAAEAGAPTISADAMEAVAAAHGLGDVRQLLGHAQLDIIRLEQVAREHGRWRQAAARARDTLRQIRLVKKQRTRKRPAKAKGKP